MQVTCVDLSVEQDWNPPVVELGLSLSLPMNLSHVVRRCYNLPYPHYSNKRRLAARLLRIIGHNTTCKWFVYVY